MTTPNPLEILGNRGFLQQVTDAPNLQKRFAQGRVTLYTGYDPTADSLHVGHLCTLMALKHLEMAGHRPLVVLGGGTAMVGDPSGKTDMRPMLSQAQIEANKVRVGEQIGRVLDIRGGKTLLLDNADWLLQLNHVTFLRDVGRHFSVNRMLSAEAYKQRLARGLSFIELTYQLLQAFDFLHLHRTYDCLLQVGGDDQWGNILAGCDLCRRSEGATVYGLTLPLVTTATGEKMGKTAAGAVWLDAKRLSPYDFYQYWINIHDGDVVRFLGFYTFLPMAEVAAVGHLAGAELNAAKAILAYEATRIVHGQAAADRAHSAAQGAFGGKALPAAVLPSSQVPRASHADPTHIPTLELDNAALGGGIHLANLIADSGLAPSRRQAQRLVAQGVVRVGDTKVSDAHMAITREFFADGPLLLWVGKKKVQRILLSDSSDR